MLWIKDLISQFSELSYLKLSPRLHSCP